MVIHAVLAIVNVPFVTAYFTKSVPRQIVDCGSGEKNAAFAYPLADRPLRRSRYGRCARKPMVKESAATYRDMSYRRTRQLSCPHLVPTVS